MLVFLLAMFFINIPISVHIFDKIYSFLLSIKHVLVIRVYTHISITCSFITLNVQMGP